MVECLESGLVEVRLRLHRGAQYGGGLTQPLGVVLCRAATQCQQRHGALVRAHDLALAPHQGLELLAKFGEGGVLQPALARLDERGGQRGPVHLIGLCRLAEVGPGAGLHAVVETQVVGQRRFLRAVITGGAARQQLGRQLVDADRTAGFLIRVEYGVAALGEVRPQACQLLGGKANLLADLVAHPTQIAEADAIDSQQFTGVVDAHALQDVLRFQAVAQLGHGGERRRCHGDSSKPLGRPRSAGWRHLALGKDRAPRAQHVFGVVEALAVVALQGLEEERGEALARDRVEDIALDAGLDLEHGRGGLPIAPYRRLTDRHLVERDGQREAFGIQVPARRPSQRQERVEVRVRAGRDVVGRRAAQREVKQHKLQLAAAIFGDADVLGLDVAMGDTFGFEVVRRFDQLFTEALQHVERQPPLLLELLGHRAGARALEQQGGAPGNDERLAMGHDVLVMQPLEYLALCGQTVVVRDVASDLEDMLFVAAVLAHQ